jgi:hypothetical protein
MVVIPTASMKAAPAIPLMSLFNMICVSCVMRNTIVPLVEEVPGKAALKEPAFTADALPAVAVRGAAGASRARAGAGEGGGRADCGDQTQSSDELDGLVQHDVLLFLGAFPFDVEAGTIPPLMD